MFSPDKKLQWQLKKSQQRNAAGGTQIECQFLLLNYSQLWLWRFQLSWLHFKFQVILSATFSVTLSIYRSDLSYFTLPQFPINSTFIWWDIFNSITLGQHSLSPLIKLPSDGKCNNTAQRGGIKWVFLYQSAFLYIMTLHQVTHEGKREGWWNMDCATDTTTNLAVVKVITGLYVLNNCHNS